MKRKNLQGYVRLDSNQRPIGASLIARKKKPYGRFKEMLNPSQDICCPPAGPVGCSSSLWLNTITENQNMYGPSVIDAATCNVYKAGTLSSSQGPVVTAFDAAGDVLWSKRYNPVEFLTGTYSFIATISLVNNVLYLVLMPSNVNTLFDIIIKIDPATGDVIDTFAPTNIEAQVFGRGFAKGEVAHVDANGDIYVLGGARFVGVSPESIPTVVKIDGTTGTVVDYSCEGDTGFTNTSFSFGTRLLQDATGNFIFAYNNNSSPTASIVYKLDLSFNIVWAVNLSALTGIYMNGYAVDIAVDASGNVYGTDYETQTVFKLNGATGAISWVVSLGSTNSTDTPYLTNISVGANGSLYLSGAVSPDFLSNQGATTKDCFSIVNLSPVDGSINWGYGIDLGTPQDMWWAWNNAVSTINNGVFLGGSTSSAPSNKPFNFFKLGQANLAYTVGAYPFISATGLSITPQTASSVVLNTVPQTLTWGTASVTMVATDALPTITKTLITV